MAIQHRRGSFNKFDPSRLLPGEWAIVLSGDPNPVTGDKGVYICFAANDVKRMATIEEMVAYIHDLTDAMVEELTENAEHAWNDAEAKRDAAEKARATAETERAGAESARASAETARASAETARGAAEKARAGAETARSTAETARADAESGRIAAETVRDKAEDSREDAEADRIIAEAARVEAENARAQAEADRADAESARATAETSRADAESARATEEARRVLEFSIMEQRSKGWLRYYCAEGEYDPTSRRPTVADPDESTLYYVPAEHPTADNLWEEWQYDARGDRWELQGTTEASVSPVTTDQIDDIIAGEAVASGNVLQATGLAYFRSLLETTGIGQLWGGDSQ